jgi:hypothetical protein
VNDDISPIALLKENSSPGATKTPFTLAAASPTLKTRLGIE